MTECEDSGLRGLARFTQRTQAASADVDPKADSANDDLLAMDVRPEIAIRPSLGKTHVLAKCLGFSTNVTCPSHSGSPFGML